MSTIWQNTEGTYKDIKVFIGDMFVYLENALVTPKIFDTGLLKENIDASKHGIYYNQYGKMSVLVPPASVNVFEKVVIEEADIQHLAFDEIQMGLQFYVNSPIGESLMALSQRMTEAAWQKYASQVVARSMALKIDSLALNYAKLNSYHQIGTPGIAITPLDLLKVRTLYTNLGVDAVGMRLVMNANANQNIAQYFTQSGFNPNSVPQKALDSTFYTGVVPPNIYGIDRVLTSPAIPYHTVGNHDAVSLAKVNAAPVQQTSAAMLASNAYNAVSNPDGDYIPTSTVVIKRAALGSGSTTYLKAGDVISFGTTATLTSGVYKINPETKSSFGELAQFVVQKDVDLASASGSTASVILKPAMIGPSAESLLRDRQNVSQLPTLDMVVNVAGSPNSMYGINFITIPDSFIYCSPPQAMPHDKPSAQLTLPEIPFHIRGQYSSDAYKDIFFYRYDCLLGCYAYRPMTAVRVVGT